MAVEDTWNLVGKPEEKRQFA